MALGAGAGVTARRILTVPEVICLAPTWLSHLGFVILLSIHKALCGLKNILF